MSEVILISPVFCIHLIRTTDYTFHSRYSNFYSLDGATTVVFLPRDAMHTRYYSHGPVSVSVCLSQAGILLKRQNVGSHKQHHTIPQGL